MKRHGSGGPPAGPREVLPHGRGLCYQCLREFQALQPVSKCSKERVVILSEAKNLNEIDRKSAIERYY